MIIVKNISEGNEIKFIPRDGKINKVVLTDEVTGEVTEEALSFTEEGYYSVCTIQTDLVDHRKYNLKVVGDDGEVLYNDLVFCSTQENEEYSINNEEVDFTAAPAQDSPKFITI
tara:strand:+ start:702 stop:1043 length:342 start_codon:yes stop_codon:yes gene_type:complete